MRRSATVKPSSRRHWLRVCAVAGAARSGKSWYVDETYIKVHGHWRYLYRAIDRNGALVDVMFSEHRDMAAAMAFFQSAKTVTDVIPNRVTTDGHDSYPRAIRTTLGAGVQHRDSQYLNNRLEQDHRGIKGRYQPMRGFQCPRSADRFCRGYEPGEKLRLLALACGFSLLLVSADDRQKARDRLVELIDATSKVFERPSAHG